MMLAGRLAFTVLAALQVLGLAENDWTQWAQCAHDPIVAQQTSERRLSWDNDFNAYKTKYQLMTIDATTGNLLINTRSGLWNDLQQLEEPVKVIVLFGQAASGKSTVGSMMSCHMNREGGFLFPSYDNTETYTEGIWSSPPFDYTASDGTTSKYMIFDMQSLNRRTHFFQGKLDPVRTDHALYKFLAMLSEVASVFVQVLSSEEASASDWAIIGGAFQTTRESILASAKYTEGEGAAVNTETDIRAHNQPAMIVLPRTRRNKWEMVEENNFVANSAFYETSAMVDFQALQSMPVFADLMNQNFEPIEHNNTAEYPFAYSSVPEVAEPSIDGGKFNWASTVAYPFEEGAACAVFDRMYSSYWNCTINSESKQRPSVPAMYRLMIEHLVGKITEAGPVRMLQWKDAAEPMPLTGSRLQEVLQAGITEMNKVGPLPQTELWRKIMQDRCAVEVTDFLDYNYGEKSGEYDGNPASTGILAQIATGLEALETNISATIDVMTDEWRRLNALWTSQPPVANAIDTWFGTKVLMKSVQPTCTVAGVRHADLLTEMYETKVESWGALQEQKRRLDTEARLLDALREIDGLEWHVWWQEMRLYILVVSIAGFFILCFLMRVYSQCSATCKFCFACCGDCGDTKIETTVVRTVHDDGTVVTGVHHATEGPSLPSAFATAVGTQDAPSVSEERYKRLQGIDATIEELKDAERRNAV